METHAKLDQQTNNKRYLMSLRLGLRGLKVSSPSPLPEAPEKMVFKMLMFTSVLRVRLKISTPG